MKKKQSSGSVLGTPDTIPIVQENLHEYFHLFFSDLTQPNSTLEKDCLTLIIHIAALGVTKFLQKKEEITPGKSNEKYYESANFYKNHLNNNSLSIAFQEIIFFALLSSKNNQPLQKEIVHIFQETFGQKFNKNIILDKLEAHLVQRCFAIAQDLGLPVSEIIVRLLDAANTIAQMATHPEYPRQESLIHEMNELSRILFSTTLSDLLPPHVSHQQKLENLMSDHLPQLHRVNGISILNWNILTKNFFIGYADVLHGKSAIESNGEYKKRLSNIANYLVKITQDFDIDIIALQEAYDDLYEYLPKDFLKEWSFIADNKWKIMLGRKKIWEIDQSIDLAKKLQKEFEKHKIHTIKSHEFQGYVLKNKKTKQIMCIYNVYIAHEDGPDNLEKAMQTMKNFHQKEKDLANIPCCVIGDFNRRLQSNDIYAHDNATHLVPPMFRHITHPARLYDYTDCCFEILNGEITQNQGVLLDTQNPGQIFKRPLLSLQHALGDKHYTKVIFPMSHKIRFIDKNSQFYGSISMEIFKQKLEKITGQKILKILIDKNRYGVLFLHLHFKKNAPLLDDLRLNGKAGYYHFRVVPHNSDHRDMRKAVTQKELDALNIVQLINTSGDIINLSFDSQSPENAQNKDDFAKN